MPRRVKAFNGPSDKGFSLKGFAGVRILITRLRDITAWIAVAGFISPVASEEFIISINPIGNGPWPDLLPRPWYFQVGLQARNLTLVVTVVAGLISLPRRKAVTALVVTVMYVAYAYWIFVHY